PQTLQCAIGPARPLPSQRAYGFGCFGPRDRTRDINDALSLLVQSESKISIFSERFETQAAGFVNRALSESTDRPGHDGYAIPAVVSTSIEIEPAGVFQRLTPRNERPEISDLGMPGHGTDVPIGE